MSAKGFIGGVAGTVAGLGALALIVIIIAYAWGKGKSLAGPMATTGVK